MQFQVDRKELQKALRTVSAIIPKKSSCEALEGVQIEAFGGYIMLTGTDLEAEITVKIPAVVTEPGALCTLAKPLANVLKAFSDLLADFSGDAVDGFPLDAYDALPRIAPKGDPLSFTLPNTEGVRYAMAENDVRWFLNGMCIDISGRLIATDGYRMAVAVFPPFAPTERRALVPQHIVRLLPKADVNAMLYDKHAVFTLGGTAWATRLIEGAYPDVDLVIPTDKPACSVTVPRDALLAVAQKAVSAKAEAVLMNFIPGILDATLFINKTPLVTHIPCNYVGKPETVALGAKYLLECLKSQQDPIVIDVRDMQSTSVMVFRQETSKHLIMPRRM